MDQSDSRRNRDHRAVHPAVLRVSGDETRRWCAAVWSTGPETPKLVDEIRGLVESTLAAHWMQPPAQYEPGEGAVNSFDLVFYDEVGEGLNGRLRSEGWHRVDMLGMATDEYEQFEVFVEEAADHGVDVSGRPDALWRCPVRAAEGPGDQSREEFGQGVARMLGDDVWGDSPGWFSRAFCDELGRVANIDIGPNRQGLATLEETVVDTGTEGIRWIDGLAYQALCDFVGVVVQATTSLEVQWGTCPVDEQTGLAPTPLMRMRDGWGWTRIPVGRDVVQRVALPWHRPPEAPKVGAITVGLVEEYEERVQAG